jgi:hypothetical protein
MPCSTLPLFIAEFRHMPPLYYAFDMRCHATPRLPADFSRARRTAISLFIAARRERHTV